MKRGEQKTGMGTDLESEEEASLAENDLYGVERYLQRDEGSVLLLFYTP